MRSEEISVIIWTFDRIKKVISPISKLSHSLKDRAAKFVDKMSAIGGTMGLTSSLKLKRAFLEKFIVI